MVQVKLWLLIAAAVAFVLLVIVAFFAGVKRRMIVAERELGSAEEEAKRLISDAIKTAESKKKEALVEAKDEIYRMKNEAEREVKERRSEVQRQEHRLQQKEENLDKKIDNLEKKEEVMQRRQAEVEERLQEVEQIKKSQFEMLEKVSGFSKEQAKEYMLQMLENELTHEKALKITQYEQQLKEESDEKAREILSTAIQRCASDHVAEVTVSVVPLRYPGNSLTLAYTGKQAVKPLPPMDSHSTPWTATGRYPRICMMPQTSLLGTPMVRYLPLQAAVLS